MAAFMPLGAVGAQVVLPDTGWYLREQERQSCESRGGRYRYPNCEYDQRGQGRGRAIGGGPAGSLVNRNYGICTYDLLIAYVPRGAREYVVEGWWSAQPFDFFALQQPDDSYVVPSEEHPIYYYVRWTDRDRQSNLSRDRLFRHDGRDYNMTRLTTGEQDGARWIEIICF